MSFLEKPERIVNRQGPREHYITYTVSRLYIYIYIYCIWIYMCIYMDMYTYILYIDICNVYGGFPKSWYPWYPKIIPN
jgi:hypothetical protein